MPALRGWRGGSVMGAPYRIPRFEELREGLGQTRLHRRPHERRLEGATFGKARIAESLDRPTPIAHALSEGPTIGPRLSRRPEYHQREEGNDARNRYRQPGGHGFLPYGRR